MYKMAGIFNQSGCKMCQKKHYFMGFKFGNVLFWKKDLTYEGHGSQKLVLYGINKMIFKIILLQMLIFFAVTFQNMKQIIAFFICLFLSFASGIPQCTSQEKSQLQKEFIECITKVEENFVDLQSHGNNVSENKTFHQERFARVCKMVDNAIFGCSVTISRCYNPQDLK